MFINFNIRDKKRCFKFLFITFISLGSHTVFGMEEEAKTKNNENYTLTTKIPGGIQIIQKYKNNRLASETRLNKNGECIKRNGINYTVLDAPNQFNEEITSLLVRKYQEKLLQKRKKNEDENDFHPCGTCGVLSLRNARLMIDFLRTEDDVEKAEILNKIKSDAEATDSVKFLAENNIKTSWLDDRELKERSEESGIEDNVTIVNSALQAENIMDHFTTEHTNFTTNENYFHIFIINTSDIGSSGILDELKEKFEKENSDFKINQESLKKLKERHGEHWYVLALEKKGGKKTCFILDTVPKSRKSQMEDNNLNIRRNIFFCESMFSGASRIKFRRAVIKVGKNLFEKEFSKEALAEARLKVEEKFKDQKDNKKLCLKMGIVLAIEDILTKLKCIELSKKVKYLNERQRLSDLAMLPQLQRLLLDLTSLLETAISRLDESESKTRIIELLYSTFDGISTIVEKYPNDDTPKLLEIYKEICILIFSEYSEIL